MGRRTLIITLTAGALAAPATAAKAPPTRTPQDAVDAVRTVVKRTMKACKTDWATIHAVGYAGSWTITVKVRDSKAGAGTGHWFIGNGWPRAENALAKAIAHRCR
ncbi:MAG: hypothetical protein ACJ762_13905 [Solirubrobacteraceae bacterium]